jgi:hypothetical protein
MTKLSGRLDYIERCEGGSQRGRVANVSAAETKRVPAKPAISQMRCARRQFITGQVAAGQVQLGEGWQVAQVLRYNSCIKYKAIKIDGEVAELATAPGPLTEIGALKIRRCATLNNNASDGHMDGHVPDRSFLCSSSLVSAVSSCRLSGSGPASSERKCNISGRDQWKGSAEGISGRDQWKGRGTTSEGMLNGAGMVRVR